MAGGIHNKEEMILLGDAFNVSGVRLAEAIRYIEIRNGFAHEHPPFSVFVDLVSQFLSQANREHC